mmetsp:Transcript_5866/g.13993  ORF Transcript_5866/g.13993 Transcript_5866/m.13993 type:complete len:445 (-) Transcript_5866:85-1419(-)
MVGNEGRPTIGQHVYIAGTGKWWSGHNFGAVVTDVRDADDTVKVRYTDGGFKRFKFEEYRSLVSEHAPPPQMWEEWHIPDKVSDASHMHNNIVHAVRRGDTLRAQELQQQYQNLVEKDDEVQALRRRLREAVHRAEYLEAHEIQQKLIKVGGQSAASSASSPEEESPYKEALRSAAMHALGGGLAGGTAMVLQVSTLMWLRTAMNYQYRHGIGMVEAMRVLYAEGGVGRFYQGIGPALVQAPLARFGDTASNAGVLALMDQTEARFWPAWLKTLFASTLAAGGRIALVPVDTVKTIMQVQGRSGLKHLQRKWRAGGVPVLFHGAMATSFATFVSHYPWFTVFNTLNARVPNYEERSRQLLRNGGIGFCASVCSDTVSNSLRVVKTLRQTMDTTSYWGLVRRVVETDGVSSLLGRGLGTRCIANGMSGVIFSVLYKSFEGQLMGK